MKEGVEKRRSEEGQGGGISGKIAAGIQNKQQISHFRPEDYHGLLHLVT